MYWKKQHTDFQHLRIKIFYVKTYYIYGKVRTTNLPDLTHWSRSAKTKGKLQWLVQRLESISLFTEKRVSEANLVYNDNFVSYIFFPKERFSEWTKISG